MDFLTLFSQIQWDAVAKIIGIDILLGGDNAVVIAMACAAVPEANRRMAVLGGTAAAIIMRAVILVVAAFLITIPFLKVVGGLMLFWIGYKLVKGGDDDQAINSPDKVWQAIQTIAIADVVMSIDNVFAVTGASQSAGEHSLIYAVAGIVLSIPFIVFGASLLTKLIDRFPVIIWAGAGLLGWVGAEMIVTDPMVHPLLHPASSVVTFTDLFCKLIGFAVVVFAGLWANSLNEKEAQHV